MNRIEAERLAEQLRNHLQAHYGVEWNVQVWENLGWHFSASYGFLQVYPSTYGNQTKYHALLGEYGGWPIWTDNFSSVNPVEVVEHQLKLAEETIANLTEMLRSSWPGKEE